VGDVEMDNNSGTLFKPIISLSITNENKNHKWYSLLPSLKYRMVAEKKDLIRSHLIHK